MTLAADLDAGDVLAIGVAGCEYRIHNPGGRIGSKLVNGAPYEAKLLDHIRLRGLSGTAFDVGAHVGNHSLYLAAVCGLTVHAFEPDPQSFVALVANVALNPVLEIYPWPVAAGHATGHGSVGRDMTVRVGEGDVMVRRIDDLVTVDDLAVVKVDVEGMEAEALMGMADHLERCRPVVYAETHTRKAARRIGAVLAPFGYVASVRLEMGSVMQCWECQP